MTALTPSISHSLNTFDERAVHLRSIERPPTWREQPYTLSYLLVDHEVQADELLALLRWAARSQLPNPRVVSPDLVRWSSLFHPRFYRSIRHECAAPVAPLRWVSADLPADFQQLSRLWLQSVLFLSGVTLSAAIIQRRFSAGTIGSKLDRLWDAGTLADAGVAPEFRPLNLRERVMKLASDTSGDLARIFGIRALYMDALREIAPTAGGIERMTRASLASYTDGRFGFVENLRAKLGKSLRAVIVYGSSISGDQYADIDAVLIADDPVGVLQKLAGSSPSWQGKELNLGVYSPDEFLVMQRLSGDNLNDYGLCLWGEVDVVKKPVEQLLARNLSFGVVRQRQQLGMLSREITSCGIADDDRKSLYEYFVKIPANVAKGTFGAVGKRLPKEHVHQWLIETIGFDTATSQKQVVAGGAELALATSALATGRLLTSLNNEMHVVFEGGNNTGGIPYHECTSPSY